MLDATMSEMRAKWRYDNHSSLRAVQSKRVSEKPPMCWTGGVTWLLFGLARGVWYWTSGVARESGVQLPSGPIEASLV